MPQRAARHHRRSGHRLLGLVEIGQQLHAPLVERLAALRQRKPARRAIQQPHAEVASSSDTCRETAETDRSSRSAARAKLPASTTLANASRD